MTTDRPESMPADHVAGTAALAAPAAPSAPTNPPSPSQPVSQVAAQQGFLAAVAEVEARIEGQDGDPPPLDVAFARVLDPDEMRRSAAYQKAQVENSAAGQGGGADETCELCGEWMPIAQRGEWYDPTGTEGSVLCHPACGQRFGLEQER